VDQLKLEDFKTIRIVGQGSYGKVYLVCHADQKYAMKIIRKDILID
jgi:serine/threonine protein kinase